MLRHTKLRALAALTILLACLAAGRVHANCTLPTANEADIVYNKDYHTYQYCNGTSWVAYGGGIGSGAMSFISTQTASSSASLQFTNLPSTYNTLFLNCAGLTLSGVNAIYAYVGEGATPTWETSANYVRGITYFSVTGAGGNSGSTSATWLLATNNVVSGQPMTVTLYINNVGSSSLYKLITSYSDYDDSAFGGFIEIRQISYWAGDTNPITGLEIVPSAGTITSGTCSLYGIN
jgi:hypothetical protein